MANVAVVQSWQSIMLLKLLNSELLSVYPTLRVLTILPAMLLTSQLYQYSCPIGHWRELPSGVNNPHLERNVVYSKVV